MIEERDGRLDMSKMKQDVRLQVFVTSEMDDNLDMLSELMGLRKNEIVRVAIANYVAGFKQGVGLVREYVEKQMDDEKKKKSEEI